jgi:hypothetical protein
MRTLTFGLALAMAGALTLAPLSAAGRRQDGVIAGSAAAEAKQPLSQYVIRAMDVTNNNIVSTTTLDANAQFALNGLTPGTFMVQLVKGADPSGQGGKVVCQAGPFTLQDANSQLNDLMIKKGANVHCNRPVAAYYLLGAAAGAGVAAGVAAGGNPPAAPPPPVGVTVQSASAAQ